MTTAFDTTNNKLYIYNGAWRIAPFWLARDCPSLVTLKLRRPGSEEDRFKTPGLRYLDAKTWVGENERACESCGFPTFVRAYGPAAYHRSLLGEDGARTPGPFKPAGGVDRHVCHDCLTMATGFKVEDIAHV